ncbi:uncharacterized protein LOC141687344 [Apium graveolens]|uniref:uncharacterized protein LOC141687344 n=1 Tax=Apium graveolens TaxID=4045 RepID=UPI003D79963A
MKHVAHEHFLVLNEDYTAREGDFCCGCSEQIVSCKSFVYSCSNITSTTSTSSHVDYCTKFLLHKTCAELPPTLVHQTDPNESLVFHSVNKTQVTSIYLPYTCCQICGLPWKWFSYCSSSVSLFYVCFKCALFSFQQSKEDLIFEHPGHSHPLALIEYPSSFKCHACKVNDVTIIDVSYRCTKCQFWIHKSCGDATASFQFQFHKHPLSLSFSLPQVDHRFVQHCRLCNEALSRIEWLYCCRRCRFFTHFQCARSRTLMLSSGENETFSNLVQLPATDELSRNLLLEQFIKEIMPKECNNNNSNIFSTTYVKHWAHEEHDLKLITISELCDGKHDDDDDILLICDGCVKPIRTDDGQSYYGCVPCKFFMHKLCAELPREIEHHLWPGNTLSAEMSSEPFLFETCDGCGVDCNGIFFTWDLPSKGIIRLHIGCVTLPKIIKHEAHPHQLEQVWKDGHACNACGMSRDQYGYRSSDGTFRSTLNSVFNYRCEKCNFYICARCITYARTMKHRWDPHPLDLTYDPGMVTDHEHDFDCEYCSREINTNTWFYHCSKCDLSYDPYCLEKSSYRQYEYVKFGATDITMDRLHPHGLTFVLNKKVRRCNSCGERSHGEPVLQCAPCNTIFCMTCCNWCWVLKMYAQREIET